MHRQPSLVEADGRVDTQLDVLLGRQRGLEVVGKQQLGALPQRRIDTTGSQKGGYQGSRVLLASPWYFQGSVMMEHGQPAG